MGAALRTRITQLLGIDHPILGGGLMWLSDARYVAALVNAGCIEALRCMDSPNGMEIQQ